MEVAPPPAYELQMQDVGEHLIVHLPVRRARSDFIGGSVVLAVLLTFTCLILVHAALTHHWSDLGALFFLVLFCALAGYGLADAVFGSKTLIVTPSAVEVRHEIGRFVRARVFDAALVRNIGAAAVLDEDGEPRSDFCLKFAYGKKDVRIGEEMTQSEVEIVASAILERIRPGQSWVGTDVPEPPGVEPVGVRGFLFPAIVVAAIALIAYETLKPDHRPAKKATVAARVRPKPEEFASAREYAVALTTYVFRIGGPQLVGRPSCGARATWTEWTCRVRAKTMRPGEVVPYLCQGVGTEGIRCRLDSPIPG
jgi:hypothetical protein